MTTVGGWEEIIEVGAAVAPLLAKFELVVAAAITPSV